MTNLLNQINALGANNKLGEEVILSNPVENMPVFQQKEVEATGVEFKLFGSPANDTQREAGVIALMTASTMFFKYNFALMWSTKTNSPYIAGEDNLSYALKMEILEECKNFLV